MKNLLAGFAFTGILTCWLLACTKQTSQDPSKSGQGAGTLTLSNQTVKIGQPLTVSLPQGVIPTSIKWSVKPDSTAHVSVDSGHAMITFTRGGRYDIWASYSTTADSSKRDSCGGTIVVSDSVYTPPPPPPAYYSDTVSVQHDSLYIHPFPDTNALMLTAQSTMRYGCNPYFLYATSASVSTGISLDFQKVIYTTGGCGGMYPATSLIDLTGSVSGWPNGTYPFSVKYDGTTYTGSLTISSTHYTFSWNNPRVFITPLQVNR
ncbi:MAG: hypothetical protein JST68_10385 [Bacteroidetes bacterium]|nr:hypothetical protein [Bacteroidota bacterium]